MSKVVLWLGPVSTAMIRPAVDNTWDVRTYNTGANGGIGSAAFAEWARSLGADPLTRLAGNNAGRIVLAGFSAAHGAFEVILARAAAMRDSRLAGLLACDAYYSAWNVATPKPGYLAWLQMALEWNLPAWLSTSTNHPKEHPSATESIRPLVEALGLRESAPPSVLLTDELPVPRAHGRGSVVWLDYGAQLKHAEHATRFGPIAMRDGPFLHASSSFASEPSTPAHAARASAISHALPQAPAPSPAPGPAPVPPPAPSSGGGAVLLGVAAAVGLGFLFSHVSR